MPKPLPTTNIRNDGYVGILLFTVLLMGVGILMLYVENEEYQFEDQPKTATPQKVSSLLKLKSIAPAEAPVAPEPKPPEARRLPLAAPVLMVSAPVSALVLAPEPTAPKSAEASAPLVKADATPVEPEAPVLRPGFTLPRPQR